MCIRERRQVHAWPARWQRRAYGVGEDEYGSPWIWIGTKCRCPHSVKEGNGLRSRWTGGDAAPAALAACVPVSLGQSFRVCGG